MTLVKDSNSYAEESKSNLEQQHANNNSGYYAAPSQHARTSHKHNSKVANHSHMVDDNCPDTSTQGGREDGVSDNMPNI